MTQPPPELDYDTWIGPSKMVPYIPCQVHLNWRWNYNTGGGQLMDWVGHHVDIAHWGLGFDNNGPYEVEGHGDFPPRDAIWNTCTKYRVECKYPDDIHMTIAGGHDDIRSGTKWIGTDGWVWVDRGDSSFDSSNEDWNVNRRTALRPGQNPAPSFHQSLPQLHCLRKVAPADDCAGGDGASFDHSGASGFDLDAGWPESCAGTHKARRSWATLKRRP